MEDEAQKPPAASEQTFRDHIATVDESGERVWLYPRKPHGRYYTARTVLSWALLAFLFLAPFVQIGGRPILLFNIIERKFIIFGLGFWPQDLFLFALSLITFIVFIILFTVIFGRLFCGWICPQTIFLEMLFRKIEYLIEGDSHKQRQLDKAPWTSEKIFKKTIKHSIFYALSFLIGNTFLAYIIGAESLKKIIVDPPSEHLAGLAAMLIFSFVFYGVFAWFREQVCVMVCPYGRLQGVLLDRNSIAVSYDFKRGEPRGNPRLANAERPMGDCVDCGLCVEVCPTGIDIRDGTQLECINCTACMDACDHVMTKNDKPLGLVRYASHNSIAEGLRQRLFTPRILGYTAVLCLLLSFVGYLMLTRLPIETTILRMPGMLFQTLDDGRIQNIYNLRVINKSFDQHEVSFRIADFPTAELTVSQGLPLHLAKDSSEAAILLIRIPKDSLKTALKPLRIETLLDGKVAETISTGFNAPSHERTGK